MRRQHEHELQARDTSTRRNDGSCRRTGGEGEGGREGAKEGGREEGGREKEGGASSRFFGRKYYYLVKTNRTTVGIPIIDPSTSIYATAHTRTAALQAELESLPPARETGREAGAPLCRR